MPFMISIHPCLLLLLQVDFLLTAMRQLIGVRPDLKLLLMSATVDTQKLTDYFSSTAGTLQPYTWV
jgi:HrpA-like RNA helicase